MFLTAWTHSPVSLTEDQQKFLDREIEHISDELSQASDLIFHTVFLSEDRSGPIIMVDGREGYDDTFFLTYYEKPNWVTLDEMEN